MRLLFVLLFSLVLLGCVGSPSPEVLKQSMKPATRIIATNVDEAFACLRLNVFDGQWVNSADQRTFVVGNINRIGNINAIAELSPVDTTTSRLTIWYEGWLAGAWQRHDHLILTRCHGVQGLPMVP